MADLSALSNLAMEAMDMLSEQESEVEDAVLIVAHEGGIHWWSTTDRRWVQRALINEGLELLDEPSEVDE